MKNILQCLRDINVKHVILLVLFVIIVHVMINRVWEGFTPGWNLSSSTMLENAHGSAPAGVNALPGEPQYQQNSASPPVNPANKKGNLQDTHPEFKKQPLFMY